MNVLLAPTCVVFCSLFSLSCWAAQAAIVVRDSPLYLDASPRSTQLGKLSKDAEVILLLRQGGWYKVESTDKRVGWLRMLSVRFAREAEAHSESLAKLLGASNLAAPASGVATGVRGATSQALADDEQDGEAQLQQVDRYVPSVERVSQFAVEGELSSQSLPAIAVED